MRRWWLLALFAVAPSGCTGSAACVPDSSPSCQCSPGDSKMCTTDAGVPGLQACSMSAQWGDCAPFSDDVTVDYTPPDSMIFDTNYSYQ
jgi:hypothetical protein